MPSTTPNASHLTTLIIRPIGFYDATPLHFPPSSVGPQLSCPPAFSDLPNIHYLLLLWSTWGVGGLLSLAFAAGFS